MPDNTADTITSIAEHPRRRGRFVISVSREPFATVTAEAIAELKVRLGDVLAPHVLDALRVHDRRTAVLDRALRLLAVRGRTTSELSKTLRGSTDRQLPDDISWVIHALSERGYLDDARFANQFVRDHAASRGWGKERLRKELRRRGVAMAQIESALAEARDDAALDDTRAASAVVQKWRRTHAARDPQRDGQRLYGFLARRGFSPDVIRAAMRGALSEGEAESP